MHSDVRVPGLRCCGGHLVALDDPGKSMLGLVSVWVLPESGWAVHVCKWSDSSCTCTLYMLYMYHFKLVTKLAVYSNHYGGTITEPLAYTMKEIIKTLKLKRVVKTHTEHCTCING